MLATRIVTLRKITEIRNRHPCLICKEDGSAPSRAALARRNYGDLDAAIL
jgi:hypothetical protein